MIHWDRTSLLVRVLSPLGSLAGCPPSGQAPLLKHAAPLLRMPGQHGPTHVDLIPGKALIPAAIQAMSGFEMPNDRLTVRPQPLQALEPGGVGIPRARLALGRDTYTRHLGRPHTDLFMPRVRH